MIKELTGNEDVSKLGVIISENLSKVLNFTQNVSEFQQRHERTQNVFFLFYLKKIIFKGT